MPGSSVSFFLPFGTQIMVQAFCNASWQERATITPSNGTPVVLSGSGFYDTPMGAFALTTAASGPAPQGDPVTVTIEHSSDGGATWQPSQVDVGPCQIMYYNMYIVASEDSGDDTWDDATVYFTWTAMPPSAPSKARTALAVPNMNPHDRA